MEWQELKNSFTMATVKPSESIEQALTELCQHIKQHLIPKNEGIAWDCYRDQFHRGKPMVFVGETPIPKAAGLFHDDACVFVFLSDDGVTKCVIQVF